MQQTLNTDGKTIVLSSKKAETVSEIYLYLWLYPVQQFNMSLKTHCVRHNNAIAVNCCAVEVSTPTLQVACV